MSRKLQNRGLFLFIFCVGFFEYYRYRNYTLTKQEETTVKPESVFEITTTTKATPTTTVIASKCPEL